MSDDVKISRIIPPFPIVQATGAKKKVTKAIAIIMALQDVTNAIYAVVNGALLVTYRPKDIRTHKAKISIRAIPDEVPGAAISGAGQFRHLHIPNPIAAEIIAELGEREIWKRPETKDE